MKWTFRFAVVDGIPIRIHIKFFLILLLSAYQWFGLTGALSGTLVGQLLIIPLLVRVTVHDLGHSLVARAFGLPVREIVLSPPLQSGFAWRRQTG